MALPLSLKGISSAFAAAQALVDLATEQANSAADERNEKEIDDLSLAYGKGATGRGMASGGSKAIKELEKEQKTRSTRMVRDGLDAALLDIATFYRDVMMVQAGSNDGLINKEGNVLLTSICSFSNSFIALLPPLAMPRPVAPLP